ncbi:hypothetical protein [Phenylobacterium sp.]|uniref:hypothetical protein n=1 Tax=Phenylobacterium sp. TaxID=1871053 RepID=UPI002F931E3D
MTAKGLFATGAVPLEPGQVVERGPAEIDAPLSVEYRLAGWNKRYALLELHVATPSGSGMATYVTPVRGPDGSAELAIMGGRLKLAPTANGKDLVVSIAQPLQAEGRVPY